MRPVPSSCLRDRPILLGGSVIQWDNGPRRVTRSGCRLAVAASLAGVAGGAGIAVGAARTAGTGRAGATQPAATTCTATAAGATRATRTARSPARNFEQASAVGRMYESE